MRAGIETKAAKAGALRGRSGRKRRDRAEKSCPGFDLRGELRTTGPYLPAKWRSQRNGQVFRVRKGSGASAGNDQRGERRKPVPPPDCMGPGPRSKEGPLLYRNGVSFGDYIRFYPWLISEERPVRLFGQGRRLQELTGLGVGHSLIRLPVQ